MRKLGAHETNKNREIVSCPITARKVTPTVLVRFSTFSSLFFSYLYWMNASGVLVVSLRTPTAVLGRKTHRFPSLTPPPKNLLTGYFSPPLLLFCFLFVAFPPVCVEIIGTLRSNDSTAMRSSLKFAFFQSLSQLISYPLTLSNAGEPSWG